MFAVYKKQFNVSSLSRSDDFFKQLGKKHHLDPTQQAKAALEATSQNRTGDARLLPKFYFATLRNRKFLSTRIKHFRIKVMICVLSLFI
jgi:hypothetical protein